MKREHDFAKGTTNPYPSRPRRPVTVRLDEGTIVYFKSLAAESGIPYQTLINLYLRECTATKKRLSTKWMPAR
jgi:predicted DNA binding CopG/RHH family protein